MGNMKKWIRNMGQWLYQNKKLFVQITAGMGRTWAIPTPLVALHNTLVLCDIAVTIKKATFDLRLLLLEI